MLSSSTGSNVGTLMAFMFVFYVVMFVASVYVTARIARKAGFSGWWALAAFVPFVNFAVIVAFAFVQWPLERKALSGGYNANGSTSPHLSTSPYLSTSGGATGVTDIPAPAVPAAPPAPPGYAGPVAYSTAPDSAPAAPTYGPPVR